MFEINLISPTDLSSSVNTTRVNKHRATASHRSGSGTLALRSLKEVRDMFMSMSVSRRESLLWLRFWPEAHLRPLSSPGSRELPVAPIKSHRSECNWPQEDSFHPNPPGSTDTSLNRPGEQQGTSERDRPQHHQLNQGTLVQVAVAQGSSLGNLLKEQDGFRETVL